jgi:hypothetical protein
LTFNHTPPRGGIAMKIQEFQIQAFTEAFQAESYLVQLADEKKEHRPVRVIYTPRQLLKATGFLAWMNLRGYNVYSRPVGWQYVLLDDLSRHELEELATLKPCLLIETSPANYQAWLMLEKAPQDRQDAKAICRELAERFNADLASAEPDHVGRLPGYTNRKEKHRGKGSDGGFPFVILRKSQHRLSTFHPQGGRVVVPDEPYRRKETKNSQSERDFGLACGMIEEKLPDSEIEERLRGLKAYIQRTIRNARRKVENYVY